MLVLRSLSPLTEEEKPSEKTLKFIETLRSSEEYQAICRNRLQSVVSLQDHFGKNFKDLPFSQEEKLHFLSLPINNLFDNSSLTFADSMTLVNLYDAIIDFRYIEVPSNPLPILASKKQLLKVSSAYSDELLGILLPFRMSQKELILWIKENWQELRNEMKMLESFTPTYVSKNLEIGAEIDTLKNEGLSFKQISEKLGTKYPEDERLWDYNQVRSIHQQFSTYWKKSQVSINKLRNLNSILKRT